MSTQTRARLTLGTFSGLGLNGKLLEDVSAVMRGWSRIERRRCVGCSRYLVGAVSDVPCEERASNPDDPLTRCDQCWTAFKSEGNGAATL